MLNGKMYVQFENIMIVGFKIRLFKIYIYEYVGLNIRMVFLQVVTVLSVYIY